MIVKKGFQFNRFKIISFQKGMIIQAKPQKKLYVKQFLINLLECTVLNFEQENHCL